MNSLGISSGGGGSGSGSRGPRGISVSNVTFQDNGDGTTDITFHMSDGTTYGPFGGSLINDNLLQLNKISIEGTNETDKFLIKNNSGSEVFKVDTTNGRVDVNGWVYFNNLTHNRVVINNSGGALSTLDYSATPEANSLVQYDSSGNIECNSLTAGGSIYFSNLTNDRVVINNNLGLISTMEYATAATNDALVQRDGSGNITGNTINGSLGAFSKTADAATNLLTLTNPSSHEDATAAIHFTVNDKTSSIVLNQEGAFFIGGADYNKRFEVRNGDGNAVFRVNTNQDKIDVLNLYLIGSVTSPGRKKRENEPKMRAVGVQFESKLFLLRSLKSVSKVSQR